jgi:hypothetical protein
VRGSGSIHSGFSRRPQLLGNPELIFYPPALSLVELRRLPVDILSKNLVTVLVTVIFQKRKCPEFQSILRYPVGDLFQTPSNAY